MFSVLPCRLDRDNLAAYCPPYTHTHKVGAAFNDHAGHIVRVFMPSCGRTHYAFRFSSCFCVQSTLLHRADTSTIPSRLMANGCKPFAIAGPYRSLSGAGTRGSCFPVFSRERTRSATVLLKSSLKRFTDSPYGIIVPIQRSH